jgi:cbb3-type cytochrome oxidase maturation protein
VSVLFIVVPLALLASATAVFGFVWAIRRGQLDDLTTPAYRMLQADEESIASADVRSAGNSEQNDPRVSNPHEGP